MDLTCNCDPRYRHPDAWPAEDPCGHGDTSEGCPVHDPELVRLIQRAHACGLDLSDDWNVDDLADLLADIRDEVVR